MPRACSSCGSAAPPDAKFCAQCGGRLGGETGEDVRKTVTAVFCDLVGSTSLGERTDPENLRALLERYFAVVREALERHGGAVEKFIGDAVVAFFGVPTTREDDALRAVRAAFDMLAALEGLNPELQRRWGTELAVRIGVNTGEVLVSGSAEHTVGDAVNVAARLEQAAGAGEVLVGETTWRLVREWADGEPVDPLELKGKERPVPAWRVRSVAGVTEARDGERALRAPLVGRRRELALLAQSFERAEADRSCQLVTLFGTAGVGKSRLASEFLGARHRGVRVLASRCLSYGDGTSLWPLLEMLRSSAGLTGGEDDVTGRARLIEAYGDRPDTEQVTQLLAPLAGLGGTPAPLEEVQWAVRRWIEAMARGGPVVWVVDDIHWAEPAMLAIIEDVVDWTRDAAVMVLCLARPEFLDDRPSWGGGKLNVTNILLTPLTADESAQLVGELLGGAGLPADAMARVVSGAGGTPLFVEQLLAMLVDDGLLAHVDTGWEVTGDLAGVSVPPTIGALLAARLERLSAGERQVLDAASVVGQIFYAGAAAELAALAPTVVVGHLRSLARKEMIRSDRSDIAGEEGFAFAHILVRDSAYNALPKLRRADLHERLARWLDKRVDGLGAEADQFVGHHLAEAALLRRGMGVVGAGADTLAEEAAGRLAAAAWRLMAGDVGSAATLYARAADLVPGTTMAVEMRLRHGTAVFRAQEFSAARDALDGLVEEAERCGHRGLVLRARLAWLDVMAHTAGDITMDDIASAAAAAVDYFEAAGDDEGLALAYDARAKQANVTARWEEMAVLTEKVMHHAARCGDRHLFEQAHSFRCVALSWGPRPALEVLDLLQREAAGGETTRMALGGRRMAEGILLAYCDRPHEARQAFADAGRAFEDTHNAWPLLHLRFSSVVAENIMGDSAAAERDLVELFAELERRGESSFLSTVAPLLGEIRWQQGDVAEAARLAELGRSLALGEDVVTHALWRALAAKVAAIGGDVARALVLADEATQWTERSDQLSIIGDVYRSCAEVQVLAGRPGDAERALRRALEVYQAKGDIPDTRRARSALAELTRP
jgi:class 3 adenylate cyclase